jgi:anti-sigma regulatory factor (Ser/Thr protein kinase)
MTLVKKSHAIAEFTLFRVSQVDGTCQSLCRTLNANGLGSRVFTVELVARECLCNALLHGNQGDSSKPVTFRLACGPKWIRLETADQGRGFDWRKARTRTLTQDGTSGRGLIIILSYAHRVRFNQRGNHITIWLSRTN